MCKELVLLTAGVMLAGAPADAGVIYTSQTRHVAYEIEVGDIYGTAVYEDSISAPDVGPFDEDLYLNVKWPDQFWTDVEGRARVGQSSSLTDTLVTAAGMSHTRAFVEEDQSQAFAATLCESVFYIEFDLIEAVTMGLSGETSWVRSTVDPPQAVSLEITFYEGGVAVFSHLREYTYLGGVGQDDGDVFAYTNTLSAGSYALEIVASTETYSQGPWRQYAEGTATYDVTMTISVLGDMDCDGDVDTDDVPLFVQALIDPGDFTACDIGHGNINEDEAVNGLDVQGFVSALIH